jgi:hypothetical protein
MLIKSLTPGLPERSLIISRPEKNRSKLKHNKKSVTVAGYRLLVLHDAIIGL